MSTPLFAIIAIDGPDSADLRAEHRAGHLAHFGAHADKIAVAGPLGGAETGSLVIYKAADAEEALAFISADPFNLHGVWRSIQVLSFKASSGQWAA